MINQETMQLLMTKAPAVLNTDGPDPECTSSKYRFVPTLGIVDSLINDHGFRVLNAYQPQRLKTPYGLHIVEFEHSQMSRESLQALGDTQLRIWLRSAHNGQSSYQLGFGLFRLVCSNGLTIADKAHQYSVRITHLGGAPVMAERAVRELNERVTGFLDTVKRVQGGYASAQDTLKLIRSGLGARGYKDTPPPSLIHALNTERRDEDYGQNLWRTLNRIQENLIQGVDFPDSSTKQGIAKLRPVNSYNTRAQISTSLFNEAVKIAA